MAMFTTSQLRAIADALADTTEGLTGSEISHFLSVCGMKDTDPQITKRHRLYNAFARSQNERQDRTRILGFIRHAMKPERHIREPHQYEPLRANLTRRRSPQEYDNVRHALSKSSCPRQSPTQRRIQSCTAHPLNLRASERPSPSCG